MFVLWFIFYIDNRENTMIQYRINDYTFAPNKKRYRTTMWCGIVLFFVMALRGATVGTDTQGYIRGYNSIPNAFPSFSVVDFFQEEVGYKILQCFFKKLGFSWQLFLAVVSVFIVYSFSKFIYKYTANIFLGFFLYGTIGLFAMSMTGLRQTLAVACVLMAFMYFKERKIIQYIIFIIFACGIHYTALICIPIGFVTLLHFRKRIQLYIIAVIPIVVRLTSSFFGNIFLRFSLRKYTFSGYFDNLDLQLSVIVELVTFAILITCLLCLLLKNEVNDRDYQFFVLLSLYVSCIELSHAMYMATRLGYYFIFFMTTMLANVIYRIDDRCTRYIGMVFMLVFPIVQFVISIPGASYGIDRYVFFWN